MGGVILVMKDINMHTPPKVAGIGEVLWDIFPDGSLLGGAPTNFACHCRQLGADAHVVSCVGNDDLGRQAIAGLKQRDVGVSYLQQHDARPTGSVAVTLDKKGKPTYDILQNVAWDYLTFTPELATFAPSLDAACFGVLGQRSEASRQTIRSLLQKMPSHALKILDVNLRKPFFSKTLVQESLTLATVLKLSDEELPVLASYFDLTGSAIEQLVALRERFDLSLVAYTRGPEGSLLVGADETVTTRGVEMTVVDSVGAGDSFTAALCMGLLKSLPLADVNVFANRVAGYVCSQKGACPKLPDHLRLT